MEREGGREGRGREREREIWKEGKEICEVLDSLSDLPGTYFGGDGYSPERERRRAEGRTSDGGQERRDAASERAKLLCLSKRQVDIDMSGQATLSSPYSDIRARCLKPPGPLQTSRGSGRAGQIQAAVLSRQQKPPE